MTQNYIEDCSCHGKRIYPFGGVSVHIQDNTINFVDYPWVKPSDKNDEDLDNTDDTIWDGTSVSEPEYDEETGSYILSTAANLAWLAENPKDTKDKVYTLTTDIDLQNKAWKPIGTSVGSIKVITFDWFEGTLDGQNHTISNLSCDVSDDYAKAGLFGAFAGTVKNLNIENASIKSTHYAGVIAAYTYGRNSEDFVIENCTITNATIIDSPKLTDAGEYDNGDKAGGIAGYINANCTIKNCKVNNTSITAYRDLGGIVGYVSGSGKVSIKLENNSVSDLSLTQDLTNGYKDFSAVENHYGPIYGWYDNNAPAVNTGNTGEVTNFELINN